MPILRKKEELGMRKLLVSALAIGLLFVPVLPSNSSSSGLKADVYIFDEEQGIPVRDPSVHEVCETLDVITTSQTLDLPEVGAGVVAGCQENFVLVRLTGSLTLAPGNYTFSFSGDDGQFLKLGNQVLTNDEIDWVNKASGGSQDVPYTANSASAIPVDFWFYEFGGGAFSQVTIRDNQGNVVDQSNIFSTSTVPAPTSATADSPVGLQLVEIKRTCNGSSWLLTGYRLSTILEIKVAGAAVPFRLVSDEKVTFESPQGITKGKHKVSYFVGEGKSTELVGTLIMKKEVSCSSTLLRFASLATGQFQLDPASATELASYLSIGSSPKRVVCIGSAHPMEGKNGRQLALQRAEDACLKVKRSLPGVATASYGFESRIVSTAFQAVAVRVIR